MITAETLRPDVRKLTVQSFKRSILGIPNLPDGPKKMVADLFSGVTSPTDGDTFITFEDPKGGFFTVDNNSAGVVIAWHDRIELEKGNVEAALVGTDGLMYREHFSQRAESPRTPIILVGEEARLKIESFCARRLQGEQI